MNNFDEFDKRLRNLEAEVARIARRMNSTPETGDWVEQVSGSMKNFPEFDEVVRLGIEFRQQQNETVE